MMSKIKTESPQTIFDPISQLVQQITDAEIANELSEESPVCAIRLAKSSSASHSPISMRSKSPNFMAKHRQEMFKNKEQKAVRIICRLANMLIITIGHIRGTCNLVRSKTA